MPEDNLPINSDELIIPLHLREALLASIATGKEQEKLKEEADRKCEELLAAHWVLQDDVQKQLNDIRPDASKKLVAQRTRKLKPGKKYLANRKEAPKDYEGKTYSNEELRWQHPHDLTTVLLQPEYAAAMIEAEKTQKELLDKKYVLQTEVQKQIKEIWPDAGRTLTSTRTAKLKPGKKYLVDGTEAPENYDGKTYSNEELRWQNPHDYMTILLHPEYAAAMIEAEKMQKKLLAALWVLQDGVQKQLNDIRPDVSNKLTANRTSKLKPGKKYLANGTEAPKNYDDKTYSNEELRWRHPHDIITVLLHPEYAIAIMEAEKKQKELLDKKYVLQTEVQKQINDIRPDASKKLVAHCTRKLKPGKKYLAGGTEAPESYDGKIYSNEELRWQHPHDLTVILLHPEYAVAIIESQRQLMIKKGADSEKVGDDAKIPDEAKAQLEKIEEKKLGKK